jgi:DNA-binding transcriptional ArsR family regulator
MSAAEVARELDITQANASYHIRTLADAGLLVEAGEEKIRGGVAKRYRHPIERTASDEADPPGPDDRMIAWQAMAHELVRRAQLQHPEPHDRKAQQLSDAEFWIDPDTWKKACDLVLEASMLLHGKAQRPRTEGTIFVNAQMAMFQMTDPKAAP